MLTHSTETSPVSETDVPVDSSPGPEATTSEVAADVKVEETPAPTLLDVITDVVKPKAEDTPAEASSAKGTEEPGSEGVEGVAAKAEDTENFENEPFGRHPRFQQVLSDRNSLRTKVEALRAPAENYTKIETFLAQNDISNEEMVDLFKVAALAKADPGEALKALQPLLSDLYERTGAFLPDDLRTDVEEGKITEERGRELARTRAQARELESQNSRMRERDAAVSEETKAEQRAAALGSAYADWENARKAKDPDFADKEDLIADRCRAIIAAKGQPASAAEMTGILDQAYTDVTARLRKMIPAREEIRPAARSNSPSATAQPNSLKEALAQAAAQGR
jgi:hypothetical protein